MNLLKKIVFLFLLFVALTNVTENAMSFIQNRLSDIENSQGTANCNNNLSSESQTTIDEVVADILYLDIIPQSKGQRLYTRDINIHLYFSTSIWQPPKI
jgi:hypothetical protein